MNLYRVTSTHYAPKDSHSSTMGFLLAESNEEVYDFLKDQFEFYGDKYFCGWSYNEDDTDEDTENLKDFYCRIGGEDFDEDAEVEDAYYGVTHYGWQLWLADVTEEQIEVLLVIGVAIKVY